VKQIKEKRPITMTFGDMSRFMLTLFQLDNPVEEIGIRHEEKIFETLATKEELSRAIDLGDYFRIMMDDRDLSTTSTSSRATREESWREITPQKAPLNSPKPNFGNSYYAYLRFDRSWSSSG
jgi:FlaA1/EpsC-like NDP-sugar epimerase